MTDILDNEDENNPQNVTATGNTISLTPNVTQGGGGPGLVGATGGQTGGLTGGAAASGGGGSSVAGPANAGGPPTPGTPANSSGQFTNLQSYLNAGSGDINSLINQLNSFYQTQGQNTQNTIGSNVSSFNQAVNAGTTPLNQDLINQMLANPTSFAQNAGNVSNYQAMENAQYGGPQSFQSSNFYAPASGAVQSWQQYVNDLNTPNSYGAAITAANQGAPLSAGQLALDTQLLQNNPNALQGIQNTIGSFGNFQDILNQQAQQQNQDVQNAIANSTNTANTAKNAVTGQETNLQNAINNQVTAANQNVQNENTALQNLLQNYNTNTPVSQQQLNELGVTTPQLQTLANLETTGNQAGLNANLPGLQTFLTPTAATINANNVATPEQYAQLAALNQIAGGSPNNFINTPAQAGSAPTATEQLNYNNAYQTLNNDITTAQANLNQQQQNKIAQEQVNATKQGSSFNLLGALASVATIASAIC